MSKFKRIFTIVVDSLGVGALPDAADYGDVGTDTLGHIAKYRAGTDKGFNIPNLQKLGMANLNIPSAFYTMLPYIISLVILVFTSKKSRAPKAEGIPYDKGVR